MSGQVLPISCGFRSLCRAVLRAACRERLWDPVVADVHLHNSVEKVNLAELCRWCLIVWPPLFVAGRTVCSTSGSSSSRCSRQAQDLCPRQHGLPHRPRTPTDAGTPPPSHPTPPRPRPSSDPAVRSRQGATQAAVSVSPSSCGFRSRRVPGYRVTSTALVCPASVTTPASCVVGSDSQGR